MPTATLLFVLTTEVTHTTLSTSTSTYEFELYAVYAIVRWSQRKNRKNVASHKQEWDLRRTITCDRRLCGQDSGMDSNPFNILHTQHVHRFTSYTPALEPATRIQVDACMMYIVYRGMSQQFGSEVERQGKANKSTTPRTALSFKEKMKSCPGWDSNPRHSAV